ncbi:uncharacterized protein TNCV_1409131 [Trichonephila clavipes]|uniref:Uncharacterized protein n=1 Tax=Trichonephila clavipes TaxID=2585209 RepID=A0A8X6UP37_TRICX|nr:uncharacterized protein TNCV_1409131 [Trichonephila clavipes]
MNWKFEFPIACELMHTLTKLSRVSGFKVSKSYSLLLRNYPSEWNKLFNHELKTPPRFFGSSPIDRTCTHYSAIVGDKLVTLTSLVKMWLPQQKCVLWLPEFKSVARVQQRVRTEWNVLTDLPNRLIRTSTKLIKHTINNVFYHEILQILASFKIPKFQSPFKFFPIGR